MSSHQQYCYAWRSSSIGFPFTKGWHLGANSQAACPRPRPRIHQRHAVDAGWCEEHVFPAEFWTSISEARWHGILPLNAIRMNPLKKKAIKIGGDEPPYWTGRGPILGRKVLGIIFLKVLGILHEILPIDLVDLDAPASRLQRLQEEDWHSNVASVVSWVSSFQTICQRIIKVKHGGTWNVKPPKEKSC